MKVKRIIDSVVLEKNEVNMFFEGMSLLNGFLKMNQKLEDKESEAVEFEELLAFTEKVMGLKVFNDITIPEFETSSIKTAA